MSKLTWTIIISVVVVIIIIAIVYFVNKRKREQAHYDAIHNIQADLLHGINAQSSQTGLSGFVGNILGDAGNFLNNPGTSNTVGIFGSIFGAGK